MARRTVRLVVTVLLSVLVLGFPMKFHNLRKHLRTV